MAPPWRTLGDPNLEKTLKTLAIFMKFWSPQGALGDRGPGAYRPLVPKTGGFGDPDTLTGPQNPQFSGPMASSGAHGIEHSMKIL